VDWKLAPAAVDQEASEIDRASEIGELVERRAYGAAV